MPRSIWKGAISFSMVSIPVKLYLATETKTKVSFHQFCPTHQSRINNKKWCAKGEHEISQSELTKVYEYEKDTFVQIEDEDLDKVPLRSSKTIDIAGFIEDSELPGALYYQSAYYLEPEKSAAKSYALLKKTLEKTGRVAVAKFALRDRERLVSLRPQDGALLLNTLHWPEEIRSTEELELPEDVKVTAAELKLAEQIVGSMETKFEPGDFQDEYRAALMKVVEAKVAKEEIVEAEPEPEKAPVDLMTALKASVEARKQAQTKAKKTGRAGARSVKRKAS